MSVAFSRGPGLVSRCSERAIEGVSALSFLRDRKCGSGVELLEGHLRIPGLAGDILVIETDGLSSDP